MLSTLSSTVAPGTAPQFSDVPEYRPSTDDLKLAITPAPNTGLKLRLSPTQGHAEKALHHQIATLLAMRPLDVELDLSDVNCITGNLVTLLMSLRRSVTEYGGHFHITAAHPLVQELFHRTGLDLVLQIDQPVFKVSNPAFTRHKEQKPA